MKTWLHKEKTLELFKFCVVFIILNYFEFLNSVKQKAQNPEDIESIHMLFSSLKRNKGQLSIKDKIMIRKLKEKYGEK